MNALTRKLVATNSANPFVGAGVEGNTYSLNATSCLVYDMGETTYINQAWIKGVPAYTGNYYALYYSNDNQNWSYASDVSFLYADNTAYFYNLGLRARYLKLAASVDMKGTVQDFGAQMTNSHLLANGTFANMLTVDVTNQTSSILKNNVVQFTLADLGLTASDLQVGRNDIRFAADGKLLPYYDDGNTFFVRVFEIPANGSTTVSVYYGNPHAVSASYGDETFEVSPEVKTEKSLDIGTWRVALAQCGNGDILAAGANENGYIELQRSTDGGHTWQAKTTTNIQGSIGTLFADGSHLFMMTYQGDLTQDHCTSYMYYSNDNGVTWVEKTITVEGPLMEGWQGSVLGKQEEWYYFDTYSRGVKLSTYDGEGPGVDYIFPMTAGNNNEAEYSKGGKGLFATALYSTDGGMTWKNSQSKVLYGSNGRMEFGTCENAIWEQEDGTLVMYARNQPWDENNGYYNEVHFVRATSTDHGITWTLNTGEDLYSNVYAGNTEAKIIPYQGKPLLMWSGNNSLGAMSYYRTPLNIALSNDDGETFENILSLTYLTELARTNAVNPDAIIYTYQGVDYMLVSVGCSVLLIQDIGAFLGETKGAYDSFETGVEGWLTKPIKTVDNQAGVIRFDFSPVLRVTGPGTATDGKQNLQVNPGEEAWRILPQTFNGTISLNLYVGDITGGLEIALQSTYHDLEGNIPATGTVTSNPVHLKFGSDGTLASDSNIKLVNGMNRITITFDSQTRTYTLTVNGVSTTQSYTEGAEAYICFFNLWNRTQISGVCIDEFILY